MWRITAASPYWESDSGLFSLRSLWEPPPDDLFSPQMATINHRLVDYAIILPFPDPFVNDISTVW